jgi:protein SCO1/2
VAAGDRHTGQVYVFDRQARLVWRTSELPPAAEVMAALRRVA